MVINTHVSRQIIYTYFGVVKRPEAPVINFLLGFEIINLYSNLEQWLKSVQESLDKEWTFSWDLSALCSIFNLYSCSCLSYHAFPSGFGRSTWLMHDIAIRESLGHTDICEEVAAIITASNKIVPFSI